MTRAARLATILVLLAGCAVVETRHVSRSTVEPGHAAMDAHEWLEIGRVRLAVAARNDRPGISFVGPALIVPLPIIPVPASGRDPHATAASFWIDLALDPEGERFTFDAAEVLLRLDGTDRRPLRMTGPAAVVHAGVRRGAERLCAFDPSDGPRPVAPVRLAERVCLSLEFAVAPPATDVPFVLSLGGLADGGVPLALPPIRFVKGRRSILR